MSSPAESLLATARSALSEARWDKARAAFSGALDVAGFVDVSVHDAPGDPLDAIFVAIRP